MRIGPCPECNSTEVYYGKTREVQGGLRDEHQVYIPTSGLPLYADTYVCLSCGNVRLFLDEESKKDAATQLPTDKGWTKVS
ncbi:MAG: hypothetical protein HYZ26_08480 [Chloroflexi bacterium]|nr:hypothetical protein [Chloroflexota bacterium]